MSRPTALPLLAPLLLALSLSVAACAPSGPMGPDIRISAPVDDPIAWRDSEPVARFMAVMDRMAAPIADSCRTALSRAECNFMIVIDTRPEQPPSAFQTLDSQSGRPVMGFSQALLEDVENADELALIIGHEAAHHILGHLPRQRQSAQAMAVILGSMGGRGLSDEQRLRRAMTIGAEIVAHAYGPELELEADELGTELAWRAGFDPERGAGYFLRIPDPGLRPFSTHPLNAQRLAVIRATLSRLNPAGA